MNIDTKNKGFTLTELIIASFIALILITIILTIFFYGQKTYDYSSYSYLVTEETYSAIEWLKQDLSQTSLNTIRVYYDEDNREKPIGVSMESAVDPKDGTFTFDKDGTAKWRSYIFYCVEPSGEKTVGSTKVKIGNLVRWELPLDKDEINTYPVATDILPWDNRQKDSKANRRTIAREVIMPGQPINLEEKTLKSIGFRVTFVRFDPETEKVTLSYTNPALVSDADSSAKEKEAGKVPTMEKGKILTPDGNTELVNVELSVWQVSKATGNPNAFDISFRVKPDN